MKRISISEANQILLSKCPYLAAWNHAYLSIPEVYAQSSAFLSNRTVIMAMPEIRKTPRCTTWAIIQTEKNADISSACQNVETMIKENDGISIIFMGNAPTEYVTGLGYLIYHSTGSPYRDKAIRTLTLEHTEYVDSLKNDSYSTKGQFENIITNLIDSMLFGNCTGLGIFHEEKIIGAVTVSELKGTNMMMVEDIYVSPQYRQKGYGQRLLRSALALYPDRDYVYTLHRENAESKRLAEASGFLFSGEVVLGT